MPTNEPIVLQSNEAAALAVFDPTEGVTLPAIWSAVERAAPLSEDDAAPKKFAAILALGDRYPKHQSPWTHPPRHADGILILRLRQIREGNIAPDVRRMAVLKRLALLDLTDGRVFAPPALQAQFDGEPWIGPAPPRGENGWLYAGCFLVHSTFGKGRVLDVGTYKGNRIFVVQFGDRIRVLSMEHGLPHVRPDDRIG